VLSLEGGYNCDVTAECGAACVSALLREEQGQGVQLEVCVWVAGWLAGWVNVGVGVARKCMYKKGTRWVCECGSGCGAQLYV